VREAFDYNLPPLAVQTFQEPKAEDRGVELTNPCWVPSALKPSEDGTGFVLRLWNASDDEQSGRAVVRLPHRKVCLCRMDETGREELPSEGGVELTLGPWEIATVLFVA
jgi:alpha-mannosidase